MLIRGNMSTLAWICTTRSLCSMRNHSSSRTSCRSSSMSCQGTLSFFDLYYLSLLTNRSTAAF